MPGLEVLLWIFICLAIVAVVGHGIWAGLAWLFRLGTKPATRPCVFCGHPVSARAGQCTWCYRELDSPQAKALEDLAAVERQLHRFRSSGEVEPEHVQAVLEQVEASRRQLRPSLPIGNAETPIVPEWIVELPPAAPKPTAPAVAPNKPNLAAMEAASSPPAASRPPAAEIPLAAIVLPERPAAPRTSWTDVLAAFMEERNIRWGELVGGLLMVCSSVALVVSIWAPLHKIPYFQFIIFGTVSAAVYLVGLYTHYRWKLPATSSGLLIVATLLTPLDFVAMAEFSRNALTPTAAILELVFWALFLWLANLTARVLTPRAAWLLPLAVLGNSALLLLTRWVNPESPARLVVWGGLAPVGLLAGAVGWRLLTLSRSRGLRRTRRLEWPEILELFTLLGTAVFATAAAIGLLAVRAFAPGDLTSLLTRLSPAAALAGLPILAVGITVMRGAGVKELGASRLAGTCVALLGGMVMLAALGLAWPWPGWMLAVGAFDAVALAWAGFRWRLPPLSAVAIACAAIVYLTAFHLAGGHLTSPHRWQLSVEWLRLSLSGRSGAALTGLTLALAAVAEALARRGHRRHARVYLIGAAATAIAGLLLVTYHAAMEAGPDAFRAAILYALYGVAGLALVVRWPRPILASAAAALLAAAPFWALWQHPAVHHIGPLWAAVLGGESLLMAAIAAGLTFAPFRKTPLAELYCNAFACVAEWSAGLGVAAAAAIAWFDRDAILHAAAMPAAAACLAAAWFLLAWLRRSPARTWIGSTVVLAGLLHTLGSNYPGLLEQPWLTAWLIHATAAAAAAMALELWAFQRGESPTTVFWGRVFSRPLFDAALCSSTFAVLTTIVDPPSGPMPLAARLFWLAAIFLLLAWRNRDAWLVAAHQATLTAATLAAVAAWLERMGWIESLRAADLCEPRCLQALAIGLAILSLAWAVARIGVRFSGVGRGLWDGRWTVDRVVRCGVAVTQWALLASVVLPYAASPAAMQSAVGATGWSLVVLVGLTAALALWDRFGRSDLIAALLAAATVPLLIAGRFLDELAVASALRFALAATFLAATAAVCLRQRLMALCERAQARIDVGLAGAPLARAGAMLTMAAPAVALTVMAVLWQLGGVQPVGPLPGAWLAGLGPLWSHLAPLAAIVLGLVALAVRERSDGYAFSAGLTLQLAVVLGCILAALTAGRAFDEIFFVRLSQSATIAAAAWAIAWMATRRWLYGEPLRRSALLDVQQIMAGTGNFFLLAIPVLFLLLVPEKAENLPGWFAEIASPAGWIALLLAAAPIGWDMCRRRPERIIDVIGAVLLGIGSLAACGVDNSWTAYHTLIAAWTAAAAVALALGMAADRWTKLPPPRPLVQTWVIGIGLLVFMFVVKHAVVNPSSAWWLACPILAFSAIFAAMALWLQETKYVDVSGILLGAAGTLLWWSRIGANTPFDSWDLAMIDGLVQTNVVCLAIGGTAWRLLGLLGRPSEASFVSRAARLGVWLLCGLVAVCVANDLLGLPHVQPQRLDWIALGAIAAAATICLRRQSGGGPAALYALGIAALGMELLALHVSTLTFSWLAAVELAGFALAIAAIAQLLWSERPQWFAAAQAVVVAIAAALAVRIALDSRFDGVGCLQAAAIGAPALSGRPVSVVALVLLLGTSLLMARARGGERAAWQFAAIGMAAGLGCSAGWAWLPSDAPAVWLHRSVIFMTSTAATFLAATFGLRAIGLVAPQSDWIDRGKRSSPALAAAAMLALAAVLAQECLLDIAVDAAMARWAIALAVAVPAALAAACVVLAVRPQWDPLVLDKRGRQAYVYAAEILAAALLAHVRLAMPWLFHDWVRPYWMLVAMGAAFVGAGLSEWFQRRKTPVLARPLFLTALWMPLLPAIGFWFMPDHGPIGMTGQTPLVWLAMAAFYAVQAQRRRSPLCWCLAAACVNLSLWVALHQWGVAFARHPQVWLIPPALAALAAERVERRRLTESQRGGLRLAALCVLYVSSTSDMFIAGLGADWRLPLVLMALSVAGILVGMALRVRSFLFLGMTFLLVDIASEIWYAAVDLRQTWIWYACGVALGAAIIALFALFEKRRNDVLAAVGQLKNWKV